MAIIGDPDESRSILKYVFTLSGEPYPSVVRGKTAERYRLWR